jgi:hypothetical protein
MPPLGWIRPQDRTPDQHAAHAAALAAMPRFALAPVATAGPVKVVLTDFWKDPEVIADVGFEFTGFHQLTGSCVGASAGNAIFTLAAIQRKLSANPTKAFCPWWPFSYGRTRTNEGDRGQGEGAVDSVMGQTLIREGVFSCTEQGLPQFDHSDGLTLTSRLEYEWSDGASSTVTHWQAAAKVHPLGAAATLNTSQDVKTAILNGYPVLDGCDNYMGNGRVASGGGTPYTTAKYDGRGGHSTCFLGYWDHPNDGPLYLYSNQWPSSTYPKDPAGAGRCCAWTPESEVDKLFRTGGGDGETMALSHLNWFPAQPEILDWSQV